MEMFDVMKACAVKGSRLEFPPEFVMWSLFLGKTRTINKCQFTFFFCGVSGLKSLFVMEVILMCSTTKFS